MSLDWIRMRTDLYRDPKVISIADALSNPDGDLAKYVNQNWQRDMTVTRNVMRNATVGALVSVWGVARVQGVRLGDDLVLRNTYIDVVDDIADIQGFGSAMVTVGWLIETGDDLVFPRFFVEYNSEHDEKQKQQNRDRQAKYRQKQKGKRNVISNGDVTLESNAREEKRREENIIKKKSLKKNGTDDDGDYSDCFESFWESFSDVRRTKKPDAWRAWRELECESISQKVISASVSYAKSDEGRGQYCQGPGPWIDAKRWQDYQPPEKPKLSASQERQENEARRVRIIKEGRSRGMDEDVIDSALQKAGLDEL